MRAAICVLLVLAVALPAQVPGPVVRSTTTEVLLDVVVRDKKGHIVRDLRPEEIQIFEDGVPQKLRYFELFEARSERRSPEPIAAQPATPAQAPAPAIPAQVAAPAPQRDITQLREISVVTVVVGSLDAEGRKVALEAMRDFVKNNLTPDVYVGVFWIGYNLRAVQGYTNDPEKIAAGMERAVSRNWLMPPDPNIQPESNESPTGGPPSGLIPSAPGDQTGAPTVTSQAATAAVAAAAEIQLLMATHWVNEMHDLYQDSVRELLLIRQLVQSQQAIPGRKVVLLFSAGLPVHPDTVEVLRASISAANRSNVTLYAIDTRNFAQSDLDAGRRMLAAAARASMTEQMSGGRGRVTADMVLSQDMAMTSINLNSRGNLAGLAEGTGGALLSSSDLRGPLRRAMEEVRTHYEMTYSPANSELDGAFRSIEVKVSRPGVRVFSRNGYYALPSVNGREVYPFEMLTLKALNTNPPLRQFDFHAAALRFRPGAEKQQFAFAFQMPARDLTITRDKQWAALHLAITALLKNAGGHVVERVSKNIHYQVPSAKIDELRKGVVSFTAPFLLAPGRYTVETAAVDRESMKASVRRSVLVVRPAAGLSVSDLTLVRRIDPAQGRENPADPLQARGGKVTPELSDAVSPDGGQLRFFAVAYATAQHDSPIELLLEITREGQPALRVDGGALPPGPSGVTPVLLALPADKLSPGPYEARLTLRSGAEAAATETAFTLSQTPQNQNRSRGESPKAPVSSR